MYQPTTKRRSLWSLALLTVLTLLVVACAPMQPTEPTATAEPAEPTATSEPAEPTATPEGEMGGEAIVTMVDTTFEPAEITVDAGTTVVWQNESALPHTVTAGERGSPPGMFEADVAAGDSFSFTFDEPGTYPYYCEIHPGMSGTVIVE